MFNWFKTKKKKECQPVKASKVYYNEPVPPNMKVERWGKDIDSEDKKIEELTIQALTKERRDVDNILQLKEFKSILNLNIPYIREINRYCTCQDKMRSDYFDKIIRFELNGTTSTYIYIGKTNSYIRYSIYKEFLDNASKFIFIMSDITSETSYVTISNDVIDLLKDIYCKSREYRFNSSVIVLKKCIVEYINGKMYDITDLIKDVGFYTIIDRPIIKLKSNNQKINYDKIEVNFYYNDFDLVSKIESITLLLIDPISDLLKLKNIIELNKDQKNISYEVVIRTHSKIIDKLQQGEFKDKYKVELNNEFNIQNYLNDKELKNDKENN